MSEEEKQMFNKMIYCNLINGEQALKFNRKYEDLQQKVEQLKKENKELKYDCSCSFHDAEELNQNLTEIIDERNELDTKLIQLENIRKEAIEYIKDWQSFPHTNCTTHNELKNLLNILNKGDNKE